MDIAMTEFIPLTFGVEALYPPMPLPGAQLRQVYMKLADPCRLNEYRQLGEGQGARMSEGNNRQLTVTTDRVVYRDDITRSTFSGFCEDFEPMFLALKEHLSVPVLLHTKVLIRTLMPTVMDLKTNETIAQWMTPSTTEHLRRFKRQSGGIGFRLVFPATQENHSTFNLRIEPYYRDMKLFFLENSAQFYDPVTEYAVLRAYFEEVYTFWPRQKNLWVDFGSGKCPSV